MLGHLDLATRRALFRRLGERLDPGARGVVTFDGEVRGSGREVVEETRIGRHRYIARHLPADPGYLSEYAVWDGDQMVRSARFAGNWQPVGIGDVAALAVANGMTVDIVTDGVALVRRPVEPAR